MAMPAAEGLFHRAIVQSGSTLRQMEPEQATAVCAAFLEELGLTPDMADSLSTIPFPELNAAANRAYRMADRVSSAWIQFIKTGNPNTPELPKWKAFNPDEKPTMVLCDDSHME